MSLARQVTICVPVEAQKQKLWRPPARHHRAPALCAATCGRKSVGGAPPLQLWPLSPPRSTRGCAAARERPWRGRPTIPNRPAAVSAASSRGRRRRHQAAIAAAATRPKRRHFLVVHGAPASTVAVVFVTAAAIVVATSVAVVVASAASVVVAATAVVAAAAATAEAAASTNVSAATNHAAEDPSALLRGVAAEVAATRAPLSPTRRRCRRRSRPPILSEAYHLSGSCCLFLRGTARFSPTRCCVGDGDHSSTSAEMLLWPYRPPRRGTGAAAATVPEADVTAATLTRRPRLQSPRPRHTAAAFTATAPPRNSQAPPSWSSLRPPQTQLPTPKPHAPPGPRSESTCGWKWGVRAPSFRDNRWFDGGFRRRCDRGHLGRPLLFLFFSAAAATAAAATAVVAAVVVSADAAASAAATYAPTTGIVANVRAASGYRRQCQVPGHFHRRGRRAGYGGGGWVPSASGTFCGHR